MKINLDTGDFNAKQFLLRADNPLDYWDTNNTRIKNQRTILLKNNTSEAKNSSYFFVGELQQDETKNTWNMTKGIRYGEDNKLVILTDNFKVLSNGNVEVKGTINATSGAFDQCSINAGCSMDGWNIGSNGIYKNANGYWTGMYNSWNHGERTIAGIKSANWRFIAGPSGTSRFGVTREGELAANSGKVGGWTISNNGLKSGDTYLYNSGSCQFIPNGTGNGGVGITSKNGQIQLWLTDNAWLVFGDRYLDYNGFKKLLDFIQN